MTQVQKYFSIRTLTLISILLLFLPFVNILTTEIKTDFIDGKYANDFIYKSFTGFELLKEVLQDSNEGLSGILLLLFFTLIFFQFLLSLFKITKIILILSVILILMTLGFCILIKSIDPSSRILIGCYLFGINQLFIYYRT